MTKKSFPVIGMHCASCARLIEKKLIKTDGVISANVNYGSEVATVEYDRSTTNEQKLTEAVKETGYSLAESNETKEAAKKKELEDLKLKVIVSGILTIFILAGSFLNLLSPVTLLFLTLPVMFWAGLSFFQATISGLKNRSASMDSLIAIGTSAAFLYSALSILGITKGTYFDTAATIITLILVGRYLEVRAKLHTSDAIKKLIGLQAKMARVIRGGEEVDIQIEEVKVGDKIRVRPGEKIAVDGIILEGESFIDESMVTGESIPVTKLKGDTVIGSTLNKNGTLIFKATKVGADTMLAQIVRMVESAQSSRAPIQRLADTISSYFVPVVLILAVGTFVIWFDLAPQSLGDVGLAAFTNMIAVLIIACPCAMGLATPTAIMVGTGKGAEKGILIKDASSLEILSKIKSIVFDKTGTLTVGKPVVTNITNIEVLKLAASLEVASEHPLAEAIVNYAKEKNITLEKVKGFKSITGRGVEGVIKNKKYFVGRYGNESGITLLQGEKVLGTVSVADTPKEGVREVIEKLQKKGINVWMITGDNEKTAQGIAKNIGIKNIMAGVLPGQKAEKVDELKSMGDKVAFVGDGVNDAPALAAADVGIAMGTGTDVAIEAAGVTLLNKDIKSVLAAFKLSKGTLAVIKQNLFWAFGYNIILIPVAAGILYPFTGWLLNPALAAGAMALSSLSVVTNSLRLKSIKI